MGFNIPAIGLTYSGVEIPRWVLDISGLIIIIATPQQTQLEYGHPRHPSVFVNLSTTHMEFDNYAMISQCNFVISFSSLLATA